MSDHANAYAGDYGEATEDFLHQIRPVSPAAAQCVQQIRATFGLRAAYLAGFALINLQQRQVQNMYPPSRHDLTAFTFWDELCECAGAVHLYEEAAAHLFPDMDGVDGLAGR